MAFNLARTLAWSTASGPDAVMLDDLQGNILDGHGRRSTRLLFLQFGADELAARTLVHALAKHVKSALASLKEAQAFKATGESGTPFVGLMLSAAGYRALGVPEKAPKPADGNAFDQGMFKRAALVNDDPAKIEPAYKTEIHALILIGGDPDSPVLWTSAAVAAVEAKLNALFGTAATVVHTETGRAIFKDNGVNVHGKHKIEGIEHFGYVDGRSQPLMLDELIAHEATATDGIDKWSPVFHLDQVLVDDPGSALDTALGSFFVFRKLEQDVRGFKDIIEDKLGDDLGLGELAGAMLVGRFEDGTPVVLQKGEGANDPVLNNFDYAGDVAGLRCPLHSHIRKSNPRGDVARRFGVPIASERSHIMARRGMPYGTRNAVTDPSDKPQGGVGLMFMAYQANLQNQFEFTQQSWVNNSNFLETDVGRDPIIGQHHGHLTTPIAMRNAWGDPKATVVPVGLAEFVHYRGGEYFFAPARSTLNGL